MGLHLNFDLRLPPSTSAEEVDALLTELHTFASTLSLLHMSPLLSPATAHTDDLRERLESMRWYASIIAKPFEEDPEVLHGDPDSTAGFFVHPGRGSESASFALMRGSDTDGNPACWYWRYSCKTQYASVVSDAHLVFCHTALVAMLDRAIALGIGVDVRDETYYWETRDEARLIQEVHNMNRIVARFAGAMSDTVGAEHRLEAPIFEHRDFEKLEMPDAREE